MRIPTRNVVVISWASHMFKVAFRKLEEALAAFRIYMEYWIFFVFSQCGFFKKSA